MRKLVLGLTAIVLAVTSSAAAQAGQPVFFHQSAFFHQPVFVNSKWKASTD